MEQSQNVRVIYRVRSEALEEWVVVVVEVDASPTASHPELLVVYSADHRSLLEARQSLLDGSHGGRKLIHCNNLLIHTRSL